MRLFTASQMRLADKLAAEAGVAGLFLMEQAGRAAARVAADEAGGRTAGGAVVILAGKGNNGGDGLVAARHLAAEGLPVEVVLAETGESFTGDARANYEAFAASGSGRPLLFGTDISAEELTALIRRAPVVIDALLGTGAKGPPREPAASIIRLLNGALELEAAAGAAGPSRSVAAATRPFVLAVDLPSGLDADTGRPAEPCVRADVTVTLGGVKAGLALPDAAPFVGRLHLAEIGLPEDCLERAWRSDASGPLCWLLPAEAAALLPARPLTGHKGTFGHVWIAAGSPGFTGAAVLAGLGALRSGAGLATLAVPEGCQPVVAASLPEALTKGLPQGPGGPLDDHAAWELAAAMEGDRAQALVVGPGLGATPETRSFVSVLLKGPAHRVPAVLDADALNALSLDGPADATRLLLGSGGGGTPGLVVTPHPGEMSRLLGRPVPDIQADRVGAAREAAKAWNAVVVFKGAGTVIAAPDGSAWVNATGNPGMAAGGSGDVLAGAVGGFLAQGLPPLEAALAGVSVHGLAGDIAARQIGSRGLLASDIAHRLPAAMDFMTTPAAADLYGPALIPTGR